MDGEEFGEFVEVVDGFMLEVGWGGEGEDFGAEEEIGGGS
jgi:hypothetical protein